MSSQSPDSFDYDLLVVGGGIIGCGIALEAAQRGLSTILIERGDFAAQTSSACFNIVHGGLRYLQHLDIARLRFSAREQTTLCRIAPHLTEPLPVLVPCYGFGKKGREALAIAMKLYELLATGRNVGLLPERLLGDGQLLSSEKALALAPGISSEGLRGAAVFYDAKMLSSER